VSARERTDTRRPHAARGRWRPGGAARRLPDTFAVPAVAAVLLAVALEVVGVLGVGAGLLPVPTTVAPALVAVAPIYLQNIPVTLGEAALGYALGNGLALLLALLAVGWAPLRALVYQSGLILYALPWVVVSPLAVVYLGNGMAPRALLATVACVFPTLTNTLRGLRAAPPGAREVFRLYGASGPERLRRLVLPYALPDIFTALRFTVGIAFVAALVSEWSGGASGVGTLMLYQMYRGATTELWATITLVGATTGLLFALIALLDRLALPWVRHVGAPGAPTTPHASGTDARAQQGAWHWVRARRALWTPLGTAAILAGVLVLAWSEAIALWRIPAYQMPTPGSVGDVLVHQPDVYRDDLTTTIGETVAGFLLGSALGYALALLFMLSRRLALVSFPVAIAFQAVPVVALVPLITLLLGHGTAAILCVVVLVTFFPTLLGVGRGLDALGPGPRDLFRLAGASRWETVRHLAIPASLPALFGSLRIGATAAVFGATAGEWLAGSRGLGIAMVKAAVSIDLTTLWADALLTVGLSLLLVALVVGVGRAALARSGRAAD